MTTKTKEDEDRDQRIDTLEHRITHLEQLLERMRDAQQRETWERRTRRG